MPDISLSAGVDTRGVATGLAAIENQVSRSARSIGATLSSYLTVGAVLAGLQKITSEAEKIHRESQRFGIDAESLQLISNAAIEDGLSLETVAKAMNKLIVASASAEAGNRKLIAAFHELNIDLKTFSQLNTQEKFLALSDALKEAGLSTETYAAVAEILGTRFGTALIPTMIRGSAAIRETGEAMGILKNETVAQLDAAQDTIQRFTNQITVSFGNAIEWVTRHWEALVIAITGGAYEIYLKAGAGFEALNRAAHLDLSGAKAAWDSMTESVKAFHEENQKAINDLLNPPKAPAAGGAPAKPSGMFAADIAGAKELTGAIGEVSGSVDSLAEKTRANKLRAMTDAEQLNFLLEEQRQLEQQLAAIPVDGKLSSLDKQEKFKAAIAEKDSEILLIEQKIDSAAAQRAEADLKAINTIQEKIAASEHEVLIAQLIAAGRQDEADILAIVFDYEEKIKKVLNEANEAREAGIDLIADENEALAEQLGIEEQIKLRKAEMNALDKLQGKGQGNNAGFAPGATGYGSSGALSSPYGTSPFGFPQFIQATDVRTGLIDPDKLRDIILQDMLAGLKWQATGTQQNPPPDIGFIERARQNAKATEIARLQTEQQQKDLEAYIKFIEGFARGTPDIESYLGALFQGYGRFPAGTPSPAIPGVGTSADAAVVAELRSQMGVLTEQLGALQTIVKNTTLVNV